ncbi:MAG TPA: PilX N-terminal domain-containing pilus assembly protein [Desulfobacterales bacterium]|jgi:Tfp pilus assembly protein PilX|nr:PilX N-terminal domain-containing pilus assembly protein [Desulfobacterales bacterium]
MLKSSPLKSQDGHVAIVAALVILTLLTIIGFSASRVANNEVTMARNESVHQRNFYLAEGAAMEAADILANTPNLKDNVPAWMETTPANLKVDTLRSYLNDPDIRKASAVDDANHATFVGGVEGVAPGGSLGMHAPTVYVLGIYGRCEWNGESIVKIGYRAAF